MKRCLIILAVISLSLQLTGCLDLFQSVSLSGVEVEMTIRYSIQKVLIEMGDLYSGEQIDYDELLGVTEDFSDEFEGMRL